VKKTDPDLSFTDIARKLAELWKNVDSATKKVTLPAFFVVQTSLEFFTL